MLSLEKTTEAIVPHTKKKPRKKSWNPDIAKSLKECKAVDAMWKFRDKPPATHPLFQERKAAKKALCRLQRIQAASERQTTLNEIHQTSDANSPLFYVLIQNQKNSRSTNTKQLSVENHLNKKDLLPGWEHHFSVLTKPSNNTNFTHKRQQLATTNVENPKQLSQPQPLQIPITIFEVKQAIL